MSSSRPASPRDMYDSRSASSIRTTSLPISIRRWRPPEALNNRPSGPLGSARLYLGVVEQYARLISSRARHPPLVKSSRPKGKIKIRSRTTRGSAPIYVVASRQRKTTYGDNNERERALHLAEELSKRSDIA